MRIKAVRALTALACGLLERCTTMSGKAGHMNGFGKGKGASSSGGSHAPAIEMQSYVHDRPGHDGGRGTIENWAGTATYDRNAHDLTVHTVIADRRGGGTFLMGQIAREAKALDKPFVRTTLTAPPAYGFYRNLGMLPSRESAQFAQQDLEQRAPEGLSFPVGTVGAPGRLNQDALNLFERRIKTARLQWEAPTDVVLKRSGND